MHAFTVHPQKTAPEKAPERSPRRWRRWLALFLVLLGVSAIVWAVRPNPHLARARALQKELFSPAGKALSPEERKARFAEYREQVRHLTSDQKWELSAPMRERQTAEMSRYFAMTPAEKARYLDERIDRGERMRKEWQSRGGTAKGSQPRREFGSVGGKGGGGNGGGPGGRPALSAEAKEQRRKQYLDRTTPEERARRDQFRRDLEARRRQRGLGPRT